MSFEYVRSRKHIHFAFGTIGIREHIQSLWNVYHIFKRQNSILTYATLPITKHLQLHVAYCF